MKSRNIIVAVAGLTGAAGVALGALAAHRVNDPSLATASQMLVLHASAAVAVAAHLRRTQHAPMPFNKIWILAAALFLAGSALFASDITARAIGGIRLFPMAAPTGGSTMIAGWLVLAVAAALSLRNREK